MTTWERTMEALTLSEECDDDDITIEDIMEVQFMDEEEKKCTADS